MGVIESERRLLTSLRDVARKRLGPDATDQAVEELTDRLYRGPEHREAGRRTPIERRDEERIRQATRDALARATR